MLESLRPMRLTDAARKLDIDPMEVVRLLVVAGQMPDQLALVSAHLDAVREAGALETWWDDGAMPEDKDPRRAAVRGVLRQLIDRGCVAGKGSTRMDNTWRGLDGPAREAVQAAVAALVQSGEAVTMAERSGVHLALQEDAVAGLEGLAAGGDAPASLAPLFGG